jgi:hypothetical protein
MDLDFTVLIAASWQAFQKLTMLGFALRQLSTKPCNSFSSMPISNAELALGYQGGAGALKAMGALEMGIEENELQGLVDSWRNANPNISSSATLIA